MNGVDYLDQFGKEVLAGYVRQYRPMIARLVNNYNQDNSFTDSDIDDLLQESVVVLYEKTNSPTFKLTAKPSTFIYAIAQNKLREKLKEQNKHQEIPLEQYSDILYDENYDMALDELRERRRSLLRSCIKLLSETQRQVFILFHYHNRSMKDIADQFNSTENSMKTQKYKAQKNVEDCINRKNQ